MPLQQLGGLLWPIWSVPVRMAVDAVGGDRMTGDDDAGDKRKTTADRVREWYASRSPEQVEAAEKAGREFALDLQRHVAGVSRIGDEVAAQRARRALSPRNRPPAAVHGGHCVRCRRKMLATSAIDWEVLDTDDDGGDVWVCPNCLTPAEEAAIEWDVADLMTLGEEVSGLDSDDRSSH